MMMKLKKLYYWARNDFIFLALTYLSSLVLVYLVNYQSIYLSINITDNSDYMLTSAIKIMLAIVLSLLFLVCLLRFTCCSLRIQKYHHSKSYVDFVFGIIFFFPISLNQISPDSVLFKGALYTGMCCTFFYIIFMLVVPTKKIETAFAPGAAGKDHDLLNFSESARNYSYGMVTTEHYVSVYGLYGGMGCGKSSMARMIVEWLFEIVGPKKIIYSYLSLTEANEAKDLSKLFAERWDKALSERYPRLTVIPYLPTLKPIFRDLGGNWCESLLSFMESMNCGLFPMNLKCKDMAVPTKDASIAHDIRSLFAHIPNIQEDIWMIIIDEIERAPLDEIYRLVEILERFKTAGRTGTPVKIIFLLCIAYDELKKYLGCFKEKDTRAFLLEDFFINNQKNITHTIYLPPTTSAVKQRILSQRIKGVAESYQIPSDLEWDTLAPTDLIDATKEYVDDQKKAFELCIAIIANKSLRTIKRVLDEVDSFFRVYRTARAEVRIDAIRLSDIFVLSYLRITYPEIIEFLKATVDDLFPGFRIRKRDIEGLLKEKKEEYTLNIWIKDEIGWEMPSNNEYEIKQFFGLCAKSWLDDLDKIPISKHWPSYYGSTSYPPLMKSYLRVVSDDDADDYKWVMDTYIKHKNNDLSVLESETSIDRLLEYARTVRDFVDVDSKVLTDVVNILTKRLIDGNVKLQPCDVGTTYYDELIIQIAFNITNIVESEAENPNIDKTLSHMWEIISNILSSPSVPLGAKYMLMSDFSNPQGHGGIHHRMLFAFKAIIQDNVRHKSALDKFNEVFGERDRNYYKGGKIIYTNEENFFYVLYQGWSGDSKATEEINKIRTVALRGLEKHPEAIALYWKEYSAHPKDITKRHLLIDHKLGTQLYLPLQNLIEVTKKTPNLSHEIINQMKEWEDVLRDERLYKMYEERFALRSDPNTLYAAFNRGKLDFGSK